MLKKKQIIYLVQIPRDLDVINYNADDIDSFLRIDELPIHKIEVNKKTGSILYTLHISEVLEYSFLYDEDTKKFTNRTTEDMFSKVYYFIDRDEAYSFYKEECRRIKNELSKKIEKLEFLRDVIVNKMFSEN